MTETITITGNGELILDKFELIMNLLSMGFAIGVVLFVVVAGIRLGWKIAPWALGIGLIAYILF